MKIRFATLLCLIMFSCKENQSSGSKNFDWLIGTWVQTEGVENNKTREIWKKVSNREYRAFRFIIKADDTLVRESLKLVKINKKWVYESQEPNKASISFPLLFYKPKQFLAENKENTFPNKIVYYTENDSLVTIISSEEIRRVKKFEKEK